MKTSNPMNSPDLRCPASSPAGSTLTRCLTLLLLSAGLLATRAESTNAPSSATNPPSIKPEQTETPATNAISAATNEPPAEPGDSAAPPPPPPAPVVPITPPTTNTPAGFGDKGLRMNFRGVPLDMVLNYLSDAAGFIIVLETEVKGTVDVWSNQPLSKQEAVNLLNTILNKNGYAVLQSGRTLTIVSREEARRRDIPIKTGNNPSSIPKNDEIVTQIIPVRSLNAVQLPKDLAPLLPTDTTLTANEAGNALVMTDTQMNIRRITEIIKALDSATASVNTIHVFPLQYADAKTMVTVIKEIFPSSDSRSGNNNNNGGFRFRMFGPGGPGGPFGGGGDNSNSTSGGRSGSRVSAVADDTSNSVIVSAPEDTMDAIKDLVKSLDTTVEDVTEVRVFKLKYADPSEMADLLSSLFPDDTTSSNNSQQPRFGGFFGGFQRQNNNANANQSDRMKKKGRVIAVPDRRTASVVVSADKGLMTQIGAMVEQLDANPAKKQKVFVYTLENADVQDVEQVLEDLFQDSRGRTSSSQNNNVLSQRNQQLQQSPTTTSSFGNSTGR